MELAKNVVDFGIVVNDAMRSLEFYRDTLGMSSVGDVEVDDGRMWLLECGQTMVKLMQYDTPRIASNPPGGLAGATGYRWCTIWSHDLETIIERCESGGYVIARPITTRGTRRFAIVEDPDGNWVEFFDPGAG